MQRPLGAIGPNPSCTSELFLLGCTGAKQGFGGARALFETFAPLSQKIGPHPQYGWDFPEGIPGKIPERPRKRSQSFSLEFPSRVRLGPLKPYNSRHSKPPKYVQNWLPSSTAGDTSFFGNGSGEGLSELAMEFPAVLRAFLKKPFASSPNHFGRFS